MPEKEFTTVDAIREMLAAWEKVTTFVKTSHPKLSEEEAYQLTAKIFRQSLGMDHLALVG